MKSILIITLLMTGIGMSSCTKKASTIPINDDIDSTAMILFSGRFMNGTYGATTGVARIEAVNNKWQLRLDSFEVSNGPDLKVYLSKEQQPIHFISLGSLRATSGSQVYGVNGMPDIAEYRYALIHCEKYNHLFGSALLEMK